jgi:hypothetical protein
MELPNHAFGFAIFGINFLLGWRTNDVPATVETSGDQYRIDWAPMNC